MTVKYEDNCRCVKFEVVSQEYPEYECYMILADTNWGQRVLCSDMTEDKAEWLAEILNDAHLSPEEMPVWS